MNLHIKETATLAARVDDTALVRRCASVSVAAWSLLMNQNSAQHGDHDAAALVDELVKAGIVRRRLSPRTPGNGWLISAEWRQVRDCVADAPARCAVTVTTKGGQGSSMHVRSGVVYVNGDTAVLVGCEEYGNPSAEMCVKQLQTRHIWKALQDQLFNSPELEKQLDPAGRSNDCCDGRAIVTEVTMLFFTRDAANLGQARWRSCNGVLSRLEVEGRGIQLARFRATQVPWEDLPCEFYVRMAEAARHANAHPVSVEHTAA